MVVSLTVGISHRLSTRKQGETHFFRGRRVWGPLLSETPVLLIGPVSLCTMLSRYSEGNTAGEIVNQRWEVTQLVVSYE